MITFKRVLLSKCQEEFEKGDTAIKAAEKEEAEAKARAAAGEAPAPDAPAEEKEEGEAPAAKRARSEAGGSRDAPQQQRDHPAPAEPRRHANIRTRASWAVLAALWWRPVGHLLSRSRGHSPPRPPCLSAPSAPA